MLHYIDRKVHSASRPASGRHHVHGRGAYSATKLLARRAPTSPERCVADPDGVVECGYALVLRHQASLALTCPSE